MKIRPLILILLLAITFQLSAQNWTSWRGNNHTGATEFGNPPIEFSETKNLKWKTEIPGKGHATPIVWQDQIILLSSVATEEKASRITIKRKMKLWEEDLCLQTSLILFMNTRLFL